MKKSIYRNSIIVIIASILIFISSQSALAAQIKLAWDPNTESDLAGYKLYYGTSSKSYSGIIDVGNETTYTLTNLTPGKTYFIVATAYDTLNNGSGYSNEVSGVAVEPEPLLPSPSPTITPSPLPEPTPEPASIVSEPTPTPTPEPTPPPAPEPAPTTTPSPTQQPSEIYIVVSENNSEGPPIGNVKKYEVSIANTTNVSTSNSSNISETNNSSAVEVLDSTKTPALDSNNQIKDSSKSTWSSQTDGKNVGKGGVGEVLLSRTKPRNIFTNFGDPNLMSESNEFSTSNGKLTPELLGLAPGDTAGRDKLIQFIQGYDVYNKVKSKSGLVKRAWILGAIVNSRLLVIPYGKTKSVIFVGANDGMFHAFDNATGEELWGFIPYELLPRLKGLPQSSGLQYYVDGSPKAYITKSQKIIIFGLRRGGSNYYGLDVTDPDNPKFLWEIGPETPGFSEMGQSWSTPQIGKIKYGSDEKVVFFIGGGYDENQDKKAMIAGNKKGRAVYIVDIFTGTQIWRWDFGKDPNMKYSIPSDISRVDTDGDGYVDRLYVGDMGGRLWRFDIKDTDPNAWSGRVVFNSNSATLSGKEKIFYPPDVTLEKGFEMVFFGTGDREHPNETIGVDKFYAFMDKGSNSILSENNLTNVTKDFTTVENLANKEGWFISLEEKGEKILAPPVVIFGVVYFTTFTPSLEVDGIARLYALNYRTGNPLFDLNTENDKGGPKIDLSDRSKVIGKGIPSKTVISAINGKPIAYTGIQGGVYKTPLRGSSTIIPIWWKEVRK